MSGIAWKNLQEFRVALHDLPKELHATVLAIVNAATDDTASALRANYPIGTEGRFYKGRPIVPGGLRRGVIVHKSATALVILNEVASTAPHAHLWEYGTQNRTTKKGWNRGRMPSAKAKGLQTLRSLARRYRGRMLADLNALKDLSKVA